MCLGIEGQPPCSCQNATDCLDNADSCNSTVSPPECYCSTNAPNFTVCETGKTCLNISNQPSCSCLDATDCSDSADSCNVTLSPPLCTCSSNTPTFEPCENGAICQNIARQPPCSCIDNSTCPQMQIIVTLQHLHQPACAVAMDPAMSLVKWVATV